VSNYLSSQSSWTGDIALPGSALYNTSIDIDNKFVVTYPSVILAPRTENDVALSLAATQSCSAPSFSSASGGHSAAGYCLNDGGVVLNLKTHMKQIKHLGEGQMSIEGGAIWRDIYVEALPTPYIPIGGGCPFVGIGGFMLGGGWSFLSRSYGLAADNLLAVRYVLANGTAVTASKFENTDLYWAARGGGGGNFGVAINFTIQMHQPLTLDGLMTIGQMCWNPFDPVILDLWKIWLDGYDTTPFYMDLAPAWLPIGDNGTRMYCVTVICNGEEDDCNELIEPYVMRNPPKNTVQRISYLEWSIGHVGVTDAQSGNLYLTSGTMNNGTLTVELFGKLMVLLAEAPSPRNLILFHICGGAINEIASYSTPFPHRDCQLVIQAKAIWDDDDESDANIQWINDVRSLLLPHLSGSYVNYIDPNFPDWQNAYYGDNYGRLLSVQNEYDPDHFFTFPQAVGTPP